MKPTSPTYFNATIVSQLKRPWIKQRDGTLFYGISKSGNRRTPLTTKQGNKTMYKGTRSSGIGHHTKHGDYVIDWNRVRTFVVPAFYNTELKPLVSAKVPELKHEFKGYEKGPLDTKLYLEKLKEYIRHGYVQSEASDAKCYVERG